MESLHEPDAHRDIAVASLASLAATLAAIQAHAGDEHEDTQVSSNERLEQTDSSFGAEGDHASPTHRLMS